MNAATLLLWALFGFAIAVPAGLALLLLTGRLGLRQHAYEDAPPTHQVKTGTPTMGGLVFVAALLVALAAGRVALLPELVVLVVCCALIGFVDDIITVRGGSKRGLRARTKFLATALVAVIFLRAIDAGVAPFPTDTLFHAGTFALIAPHWLWLLLGILAITGTIHAVNLTDGLDGLATGSVIPPLVVFGLIAAQSNVPAAAIAAAAGVGACAAFLIFNHHPAKLFMGDTGSLALGALLGGAAILTGEMLLLVVDRRRLRRGSAIGDRSSLLFQGDARQAHPAHEPAASSFRVGRMAGNQSHCPLLACIVHRFAARMDHRAMTDTLELHAGDAILVIGLGRSGLASLEVLAHHNVSLYATDEKPVPKH